MGDEAVRRRVQALTDLVHSVADEQPFVLVIDDVHWVDPASYRLLEGVWSRLGGAHVLCLTAARPEQLPAGDHVQLLPLAPLSPADVGSLVLALGSLPDDVPWARDFVAGLHRSTRGSPLLILETLRLAMDDGTLLLADGEWRCPDESGLASLLGAGEALRLRVRALPREQVWLLALLATAGTPLPIEHLSAATLRPAPELAGTLAVLERQGLATRTAAGWLPAHDEIAAAARDALDSEGKAGADRALGRLLVEAAGTDSHRLLRGIRHLAAAGEDGMVRRQFRRYARLAREQHDRRPFALLAAEVLADDPGSARATILARSLPGWWRLGLWTPVRTATAAAVLATVALAAIGLVNARASRLAVLQRVVYVDTTRAVRLVSVDAAEWAGRGGVLTPSRGRSTLVDAALAFRERSPAVSPDGESVAWNEDSGDSTTLDIWIRTPAGVRRLTHEARDDLVNSWLPDGSGLVGVTNRWSDPIAGNYDIAVFDTATGAVRQVTGGPNHDGRPFVSPDGTRIAFIREYDDAPARVCVVPFDAIGGPDCRLPNAHPVRQLVGWSSATEVVLAVESGRTRPVVRYDWPRDEEVLVVGPSADRPELSPDARWVVATVRTEGISGTSDWIIPVTQPAQARRVETPSRGALLRWWEGRQDATDLVDRIELTDTSRSILLGASTRLHIRALTRGGTETPVRAPVRWRSSDTLVATVDSTGEVRPRTSGAVTIEASLAGWRTTSGRFEVRGEPARTVLEEAWDDGWGTRWIPFGDPQPLVVRGPGDLRAFWNRGDGTYQSTAVLRQAYSAIQGLGVELRLSTPIGTSNWQRARTLLIAGIDTAAFRHADQKKAAPSVGRLEAACGVNYPAGTGRYGQSRIDRIGGIAQSMDLGPLAETLASGAWWTLRIQILPDGRCGIAVNGQVLWLSPEPIALDGDFRLRLGDESAGTKLLHGPLQIWTGVRTDIDWSRPPT